MNCLISDSSGNQDRISSLRISNTKQGEPFWKILQTTDELEWDTDTGEVTNLRTGLTYTAVHIAPFVTAVAESDGLMNFNKKKIADMNDEFLP